MPPSATCQKIRFGSRAEANEYTRNLRRLELHHSGGHVRDMRAYECPYCGMWHLTSMRPAEYRRMVRRRKAMA